MIEFNHWDPQRDGVLSESALRQKLEAKGYAVRRYVYPPGTCFPDHTHGEHKIDAILSGRFRITFGAQSVELTAGDWVVVPAGTVHSAEVLGDQSVVSLDAIRVR